MTPLNITGPDHRSIWKHLNIIRQALADVRQVAEHHGVVGLGDLNRRLNADQDAGFGAVEAIATILSNADEQTERRQ